jgi:hypothetical protein
VRNLWAAIAARKWASCGDAPQREAFGSPVFGFSQESNAMSAWSAPVPYGNNRFEIQDGGRRVAIVDRLDDALVISAARDLLAVVERLLKEDADDDYTIGLIEDARAAVAKAEGQA